MSALGDKRHQDQLSAIYDHLPGILFFVSVEPEGVFRFTSVNRAFLETTGLSEQQVVGRRVEEVIPPASLPLVRKHYEDAVRNVRQVKWIETSVYPSGLKHGEVAVSPLCDASGKVTQLIGSVFDVTDRREAEEEREKVSKFFSNSSDMMVIADLAAGYFRKVNPACTKILGYTEKELLERSYFELIHPDDREPSRAASTNYFKGVITPGGYENRYRCKDGTYRWFSWSTYFREGDTVVYAAGRDITERKRLEDELHTAVEARDDFLSIAAHELNTPLTALLLQLQMLNRACKESQPDAKIIAFASESSLTVARQITRLVEQLLDVTRIRSGRLSFQMEKVDLSQSVERAVALMAPQISASKSQVTIKAESSVIGSWDQNRIDQIISNLLSNAVKYGQGKPISIEITKTPDGRFAELAIRDEGIGIKPELQSKIFNRFTRAVDGKKISGLGLGLYIVKELVEAHGGTIQVESTLGAGTRFLLRLPTR